MAETACVTAILNSADKLPPKAAAVLIGGSSAPSVGNGYGILASSSSNGGQQQLRRRNNNKPPSSSTNDNDNANDEGNGFLGSSSMAPYFAGDITAGNTNNKRANINNNIIVDDEEEEEEEKEVQLHPLAHRSASFPMGPQQHQELLITGEHADINKSVVTTTAPSSSSQKGPGFKMVRPLGTMEDYIASYNTRGLGDIVYALHLKSKVPIPDEILIKALKHWQEKIQHLRLAIQDDGYRKYFVELRDPEVVFKNCGSRDWREVFEEMLAIEYDAENGPLWQSRITRMGPEDEASCKIVNGCVNHGYVLLIGFHHSLTDGTSNAKFCTVLLKIVNALMTGSTVPEGDNLELAPSMWDLAPDNLKRFGWWRLSDWLSLAKDCYNHGFNERSQYLKRYPAPKMQYHSEIRSGICTAELSTEMTSELIKACKRNGVTVSGAFTAAAGIAIYNLITKAEGSTPPLPKGKRTFTINHAVNLRRYFDKAHQDACGCYFNFFDDHMDCDERSLENFWQLAKDSSESIRVNVDNARGLKKQRNLDFIFKHFYPADWYCTWRRQRARHLAHAEFSTSNLGAVDKMFSGLGSPVEAMKMYRSTAMHYLPSLYTWFFQTFRGRFTALLEFFTNFVSREQAQDYIDETMRVLADGIELARLPPTTELMLTPAEDKRASNGHSMG